MLGLVAAGVSASLPCISPGGSGAVPAPARARGAGWTAGQVRARSEKRKSRGVIHRSALPHLQSHAASHIPSLVRALTLSDGAVRTSPPRAGVPKCSWGVCWGVSPKISSSAL